jgi:hypothetical protein
MEYERKVGYMHTETECGNTAVPLTEQNKRGKVVSIV